jgi:hypothetical protein
MKNYIEKKGLKNEDVLYTTPKGAKLKILSSWKEKVEVEVLIPIPGGSPKGAKGNMLLSTLPGLAEQITAMAEKREADFVAKYPGIDELLDIIRLHREADEALEKMMETGDSILRDNRPEISIDEAMEKYPVAAAYLHIYNLSEADPSSQIGFVRRSAADKAFANIADGADVILTANELDTVIDVTSNTPAYRDHVAGL